MRFPNDRCTYEPFAIPTIGGLSQVTKINEMTITSVTESTMKLYPIINLDRGLPLANTKPLIIIIRPIRIGLTISGIKVLCISVM